MQVTNGIPATQLPMAHWRKSRASNPSGCCVEVAALPVGRSPSATPVTRPARPWSTRAPRWGRSWPG